MIKIKNKNNCCGCGACYNACPSNAIMMIEDECGFKYPKINNSKCTRCGLCEKICTQLENELRQEILQVAYVAYNPNEKIRLSSSSGGIFTLFAEYILKQGGLVFGAQFDDKFDVVHSCIDNINDLNKLRGSKYVQSEMGDNYKKVKEFLEKGRIVLFTGTPCQIAGLKSYLIKDYDNLYTQDIICHGVPSPLVWKKYKEYREKVDNKKLIGVSFRNKDGGWKKFNLKFQYVNSEYKEIADADFFMKAFLKDTILRDSCYNCSFKAKARVSDITLGDYWGIQNVHPEMDDDKGTSAIIINSLKGQALFDEVKQELVWKETDYESIKKYNPALIQSAKKDPNREKFFKNLENLPFDELVEKYTYKPSFFRKVINKLKYEFSRFKNKISNSIGVKK